MLVVSPPACSISVTFVSEKDGSETTVKAPIGKHLLEVAHDNDVELEGASSSTAAVALKTAAAPCLNRHVLAATAQQRRSALACRACVCVVCDYGAVHVHLLLLGRPVPVPVRAQLSFATANVTALAGAMHTHRTPSGYALQVLMKGGSSRAENQQHCRARYLLVGLLSCCVAGACEASLACSTCHVIVEVRVLRSVTTDISSDICLQDGSYPAAQQQQQHHII
jgi:ferredoxin